MIRPVLALWLIIATLGSAHAQGVKEPWPDRTIRIVVPSIAGSAADVLARLVGKKLGERLGQIVVIEDRPGASGITGTSAVAKADADGYTLALVTSSMLVTAGVLNPKLPYDPVKDFAPISLVGIAPYVLTIYPGLPAHNLAELIALAKAKPGVLSYSSNGEASLAHLAAELFSSMAGIRLNHIPYKSSTQAVIDLNAGRIDMQFGILTTTHQLIRDGTLRALAVTTEKRLPELPEIPTLSESGFSGYEASLWFAVVAPAATPVGVVKRLNREINAMLSEPDIKTFLATQMIHIEISTPSELHERIRMDIKRWHALASQAKIRK